MLVKLPLFDSGPPLLPILLWRATTGSAVVPRRLSAAMPAHPVIERHGEAGSGGETASQVTCKLGRVGPFDSTGPWKEEQSKD